MPERLFGSPKPLLRKRAPLLLAAASFCGLFACSSAPPPAVSGPPAPPPKEARLPSPEEDPSAPGMIPQECQALLDKIHEWGFEPEKAWQPASSNAALEAAAFFSTFHLVPESTSKFARAWMNEIEPKNSVKAQKSLDRMDRAQSCDILLAHKLLLALLHYPWPREMRTEASHDFLLFVLNQQARVAPSTARAVQIDVLSKAVQRGFIRAGLKAVEGLRHWFEQRTAAGLAKAERTADPIQQWRLGQEELKVSEEAREKLARLLPLP